MSVSDSNARLREHLENCKIPLTRDDWAGFVKELDKLKIRELFFNDWINREQKRFDRLIKSGLFEDRVKYSFILALNQISGLRSTVRVLERLLKEECEAGGNAGLNKRMNEWWPQHQKQEAKKKRDRKPDAPCIRKNWLEAMPVFNEGQPCGYVQATGQRRKVIGKFLHTIKAKTETPLTKKQRGRPDHIYGFEINCRVLDQWLGKWCDQNPEPKYDRILTEALLLAEVVADSKSPVSNERLAKLRQIFRTHAQPIAKQTGDDFNFAFLDSPAACASQIKILREKFPPPVEPTFEERFSAYINKVIAGEPAESPF